MSDASREPRDSIRELLLGMGSSSMRKSYYPELRSKLDDLELFRELVERSSDAILLFSLPANRLLFANIAARRAFEIDGRDASGLGIEDIMGAANEAGYPACLEREEGGIEKDDVCSSFIQEGSSPDGARRFEVVINEVLVAGSRYAIAVARDSTERLLMEERIRRDLLEKETMLREIHHRVKNNFQLMKSLLSLAAYSIEDEKARLPLLESENRIMSMAGAHERLYESPDLSSVDSAAYFEDIVSTVRLAFQGILPAVSMKYSSDMLFLPLEIALPCGLILNELLSNCMRHAFPREAPGRDGRPRAEAAVSISIAAAEGEAGWGVITVGDNGMGIDKPFADGESTTVGLMLIRSLVAQIKGAISWRSEEGTIATLRFPLKLATESK
jgi:two-component sensor histidine kinase